MLHGICRRLPDFTRITRSQTTHASQTPHPTTRHAQRDATRNTVLFLHLVLVDDDKVLIVRASDPPTPKLHKPVPAHQDPIRGEVVACAEEAGPVTEDGEGRLLCLLNLRRGGFARFFVLLLGLAFLNRGGGGGGGRGGKGEGGEERRKERRKERSIGGERRESVLKVCKER